MLPTIPIPEEHDISSRNGFLPDRPPLERLPDPYYMPWEQIMQNLQGLLLSKRLKGVIHKLPILSTDRLCTPAEWRRAYSLLAFISHAFVWGGDRPSEVVPPSISIPFIETCRRLELPTVATYAGVALWNYKPLFDDEILDLENLSTIHTFTGSLDESWFYLVSVAIEARGGPIVPTMLDAIAAARVNNQRKVVESLQTTAELLDELCQLLPRMYENCDPHTFYHRIRPFLAGSRNMAEAGLPRGVMFDDGSGTSKYCHFSGGSNAQSSLIQFFDLVLGIEHRPTGEKRVGSSSESEGTGPPAPSHNFITEMRKYMPGPHRRFLERVAAVANIREFVETHRSNRALATAYDACLTMLRIFRDKHIQMVSRYIIVKSRESPSTARSISPRQVPTGRMNLAISSRAADMRGNGKNNLRGTGGTALMPFLKQARDETGEPAVEKWARRLLTNTPEQGSASLGGVDEHANGKFEIIGLAETWSIDDSEGGICHW